MSMRLKDVLVGVTLLMTHCESILKATGVGVFFWGGGWTEPRVDMTHAIWAVGQEEEEADKHSQGKGSSLGKQKPPVEN